MREELTHVGVRQDERKQKMSETFVQKLDKARNGQEFQSGLEGLFKALEKAMWEDDDE